MKKLPFIALIAFSCAMTSCTDPDSAQSSSAAPNAVTTSPQATTTATTLPSGPTDPVFSCTNDSVEEINFTSLEDVWSYSEPFAYAECDVSLNGDELDPYESEAVSILNENLEGEAKIGAVERLYSTCANRETDYDPEEFVPDPGNGNAPSLTVAKAHLALCPDHPMGEIIRSKIDTAELARAESDKPGPQRIFEGKYLVGSDIPAGTYATDSDRLEDCYWEISDQSGNIIDNNFISISPGISLTLSEGTGFTTRSCGTWTIQE